MQQVYQQQLQQQQQQQQQAAAAGRSASQLGPADGGSGAVRAADEQDENAANEISTSRQHANYCLSNCRQLCTVNILQILGQIVVNYGRIMTWIGLFWKRSAQSTYWDAISTATVCHRVLFVTVANLS